MGITKAGVFTGGAPKGLRRLYCEANGSMGRVRTYAPPLEQLAACKGDSARRLLLGTSEKFAEGKAS